MESFCQLTTECGLEQKIFSGICKYAVISVSDYEDKVKIGPSKELLNLSQSIKSYFYSKIVNWEKYSTNESRCSWEVNIGNTISRDDWKLI